MNEYRGYNWEMDTENCMRKGECVLRIEYDGNLVKAYLDQPLNEEFVKAKAESFIDGFLLGFERGKEVGADDLRHTFRRLLKVDAAHV